MNKSPNRSLIAECDRLIQQIAKLGKCAVSGLQAAVGHHLIPRITLLYRHDLRNIVPLTWQNHMTSFYSPHAQSKHFKAMMEDRRPMQCEWWEKNRFGYHKAPDRETLLKTRDYLRAFLEAGEPFVWANRLKQEN